MSNEKTQQSWVEIIQTVQTPLGFFVLVVLVIEVILATTATFSEGFDRTFLIIGMMVLIFLLVVIVAFLAYWRPDALRGKSSKDAENTLDSDTPKVGEENMVAKWRSGPPTTETILKNAEHSVILLGTSNFRVVHEDLYQYNKWLENNQRQFLGLLFINPHSPHAFRRERKDVQRSSRENIVKALKVAYTENKDNPQFIPAIYDGPYRYSAHAIDIGPNWTSSKSMISIFTSSHNRGISEGFRIRIRQNENPECFEFYRNELLDLWKTSLSNPAGHGVSIISRWPNPPPKVKKLDSLTKELLGQLTPQETDYKIFLPGQFHLTIASLCRTQTDVFAGPLCIGSEDEACDLPAHFPEFVIEAVKALADAKNNFLDFNFSRLVLDNRGYIILEPDENETGHSIQILNDFTETLQSIVDEFNEEFPNERWNQRLKNESDCRFKPKLNFFPHITIGRAFNCHNSLPISLNGEKGYIQISPPIRFDASDISIVHYAYRSLFRCVGEIPITQLCSLNKNEVVHLLGLKKFASR